MESFLDNSDSEVVVGIILLHSSLCRQPSQSESRNLLDQLLAVMSEHAVRVLNMTYMRPSPSEGPPDLVLRSDL